ncbi:TIGR04086 family membrane protein [Virgibacillus alimentarius]|uniref:Membrane protein (TIGR04086 family) n=1 Tax=Virgibacillus alimentarius TaxID=698769 RepID=A0ABS4S546_9BACI|nr:TIGR04086 family membrane protein [Virgibacillus alimentarius]MBP2256616.1 putative membrane protein (TIGR04086 family) [Virgibacillus alimentarius]
MKKQQLTALLYGWIVVLGLIFASSIVLALLLRFTSFSEPMLSWVTLVIGLICLFIGGIVAGVKGKAKGWIIGGITGFGFTLFTFLVQYLGYQQIFSFEQALHHVGYIAAALFGGVIGVNVVANDEA